MGSDVSGEERPNRTRNAALTLLVVGLALVGAGGYVHLTTGDRTLGQCVETGVCDPWDPQWVVAPLVVGAALVVGAGLLASR